MDYRDFSGHHLKICGKAAVLPTLRLESVGLNVQNQPERECLHLPKREDVLVDLPREGRSRTAVPLPLRLATEIPKPRDWQAFQRNCTLLFREELKDPNAQEYGRSGQKQRGIDILGRRNCGDDHFVGVQCRLVLKPLKYKKILLDSREALTIKGELKELIFATSAPDDTGAADAAIEVTKILRSEGHNIVVIVYGWNQLQNIIAVHEVAYNAFTPSAVASSTAQVISSTVDPNELAKLVADQIVERMQHNGQPTTPHEEYVSNDESPALHARVDVLRDLFREQGAPLLAERGLLALLGNEDFSTKPLALYRIETNLGSIAMDLGREPEAATRFEAAHSIRPNDPNAIANLALARIIQERFDEAMVLAQVALDGEPRAEQAVGYLLQAAARSDWEGEPERLIPSDLVGTVQADIGLAEFLRRRDLPNWADRSIEIAHRHAEAVEFKRIRAIAVLSLAVESGAIIGGGYGPVTSAELSEAADDMKTLVEQYLDVGFADQRDLMVHLNNSAVLLRLCERHAECEVLLVRGIPRVGDQPQLRRLLALARSAQNHDREAIATLDDDGDPENLILRAELQASTGDLAGAVASSFGVSPEGLSSRLQLVRWRILGEAAIGLDDEALFDTAVTGLRALDRHDIGASALEIKRDRKKGSDDGVAQDRLRALATSAPADLDMVSRYLLGVELRNRDLPEEASRLLEGHVDLSRPTAATSLFLESLAEARRDVAFNDALNEVAPEVRNDPATLRTIAAHSWNAGDFAKSLTTVDALLSKFPDESRARLLRVEILIRQDRSDDLFAELRKPLELLTWRNPRDALRLASILGHFGFKERAAGFAYQLFMEHRDLHRAWMTLSTLVLEESQSEGQGPTLWTSTAVGPDAAVDLIYDDGVKMSFVVEPDPGLRKLDPQSWEPNHALTRAVAGLHAGSRFTGPDGREGTVETVRHKYVAQLDYIMRRYEDRFPETFGFKSLSIDFEHSGGLDELIAQLKTRQDWIKEEVSQYANSPIAIGVLAYRVGMDTIEVGLGLADLGVKLKVSAGGWDDRVAAMRAIKRNARNGCVFDLLAFWTAWRLDALREIRAACGPIYLPQSLLDRLRARREHFDSFARDGRKNATYEKDKIVFSEVSADVVTSLRDEVSHAIKWAEINATILPVIASDALPETLREHLRRGQTDIFDALIIARQIEVLLVTDDLTTRELDRAMAGSGGAWLHAVFGAAVQTGHVDLEHYVRWSAALIDAGHSYLGVPGGVLAYAARLDAAAGEAPGYLFKTLSKMIGGRIAEPISHIQATIACLRELWGDSSTIGYRERTTSYVLNQLISERQDDYAQILRRLAYSCRSMPAVFSYLHDWLRGHFLLSAVSNSGD